MPPEKSFYCLVLFVWSMLKEESAEKFTSPNKFANLFLPMPDEKTLNSIYEVAKEFSANS